VSQPPCDSTCQACGSACEPAGDDQYSIWTPNLVIARLYGEVVCFRCGSVVEDSGKRRSVEPARPEEVVRLGDELSKMEQI
jgi:hypothetical protein